MKSNLNFFPNYKLRKPGSAFLYFISNDKKLKITYGDFEKKINIYSDFLKKNGIKEKDNILIISENNIDFIFIVFALWNLRAVPIPVNTRLTENDIKKIFLFSEAKFVLIEKSLNSKIKFPKEKIIPFPSEEKLKSLCDFNSQQKINLKNTALMIFTSGSTGKPKAVMLSFNNLIQSALTGNQFLKISSNDKLLASLPFYHIGGFSILIRAFLFGASVIVPNSLKINDLISAIEKTKPTHASFVSAQLKKLIEKNIPQIKRLKNILLGGGFISSELIEKALNKKWKISKSYGSTETSSFVTAMDSKELKNNPNASGKALPSNRIFIMDKKHKILKENERGEICIKSHSVMKGYFKNENETQKKLLNLMPTARDNLFFSGDIGYLDKNGFLIVEARRDDLIISGGENINPFEVETRILKYPGISEAFVFGLKDQKWGQIVCAAIVTKKNKKITIEELKNFLKDKLAGYKIPKKIFHFEKFPKTGLGKIKKEEIKKDAENISE